MISNTCSFGRMNSVKDDVKPEKRKDMEEIIMRLSKELVRDYSPVQRQHMQMSCVLNELMDAAEKSVTVNLTQKVVEDMKKAGYGLCIAKKVGDTFNVIWNSLDDFATYTNFSWVPLYQVYATNTFQDKVKVKVRTEAQKIGLNETCELDKYYNMKPAHSGGSLTALTVDDNYEKASYLGVSQMIRDENGNLTSLPIYVSENPVYSGTIELTPVEQVMVWFQQNAETSTMFSKAVTKNVVLDLTDFNSYEITYDGKEWMITGKE